MQILTIFIEEGPFYSQDAWVKRKRAQGMGLLEESALHESSLHESSLHEGAIHEGAFNDEEIEDEEENTI